MTRDVFHLEMLLAGRRGRRQMLRRAYAGWLIIQFAALYLDYYAVSDYYSPVWFVDRYFRTFVVQQFLVIILAVPIFVAGAITEEKTRGTLEHLLTTDLSSTSIVLGKLFSGMLQTGMVLLAGLPLVCFLGPCAAFDGPRLFGLIAATIAPLFAWSAASILWSVESRNTREAISGLYGLALIAIALPFGLQWLILFLGRYMASPYIAFLQQALLFVQDTFSFLIYLNPLFVLAPAWNVHNSEELGYRLMIASLEWLVIGVACTAPAIWRLRPAFREQLETTSRPTGRIPFLRTRVGDDPVRWKERYFDSCSPIAGLRTIPTWLGTTVVFTLTWLALDTRIFGGIGMDFYPLSFSFLTMLTGFAAIRAASSVSGERERQTWEALLLTPLDVRRLIASKLHGILWGTYPYLIAFLVPALALTFANDWPCFIWVVAAVLVTVIGLRFIVAAGIWCSARATSTWRAMLATFGIGYFGGYLLVLLGVPVVTAILFFLSLLITPIFVVFEINIPFLSPLVWPMLVVSGGLILAATFLKLSSWFILDAERRVLKERTPYWKSGINCSYAIEQFMEQFGESERALKEEPLLWAEPIALEPPPWAEPVGQSQSER
jgi:ABC-type Na+ efflux pump permease subunit